MTGKEGLIRVIHALTGSLNENNVWTGDATVTPLFVRLYRAAPEIFLELDEEACKKMFMRGIRLLTNTRIPPQYSPYFWSSEQGKRVKMKLDRRLPNLPNIRK